MPASIWRPMSANGPEKAAMTPTLIVSCAVAGTAVSAIHSVRKKSRFILLLLQCIAVDSRRDDVARRLAGRLSFLSVAIDSLRRACDNCTLRATRDATPWDARSPLVV